MVVQGIRAADADELGWLNASWLQRTRSRTSIYSIATAVACVFFSLLLLLELFETDISLFEILLSAVLMVAGFGCGAAVLLMGVRLPRWGGLVLVLLHALVAVYYIGFSDERQNAIASIQELPVMAIFLAWFYGARIGRVVELCILASVGTAMALGPFGGDAVPGSVAPGLFGWSNLFGVVAMSWLCLEIGFFVRHRIRLEAHTDALTGALNRRGLKHRMDEELRRARRTARPLAIAVLDLDDFKAVNDGDGHEAGDAVLKTLVAQWISMSRERDLVGRLGGDEFVMLLPDTTESGAMAMVGRMRQYATHPWSWGVAEVYGDDTLESAMRRADAEMYRDKRGRGRSSE
ncbi:GGDEF domain-containing protein [Microbacterium sp. USHLN186]|uniref:GGDEF domain-containing protein n=1 Tax=Microbacterium sp. USHLN186 TaxID=3081286 RepID=UPI0030179464